MRIHPTPIPGCFEIFPKILADGRGSFVKTFHRDLYDEHCLETNWREEYYSISHKGVLRGLHFQLPPHDHAKLVYCISGEALDVVLDLRIGSPAYGTHLKFQLDGITAKMIYIPRGCAHGFYALGELTTMMYKVSTVYAPEHDAGLLWDSAGIDWPDDNPIISDRDKAFPAFADLKNLFTFR